MAKRRGNPPPRHQGSGHPWRDRTLRGRPHCHAAGTSRYPTENRRGDRRGRCQHLRRAPAGRRRPHAHRRDPARTGTRTPQHRVRLSPSRGEVLSHPRGDRRPLPAGARRRRRRCDQAHPPAPARKITRGIPPPRPSAHHRRAQSHAVGHRPHQPRAGPRFRHRAGQPHLAQRDHGALPRHPGHRRPAGHLREAHHRRPRAPRRLQRQAHPQSLGINPLPIRTDRAPEGRGRAPTRLHPRNPLHHA